MTVRLMSMLVATSLLHTMACALTSGRESGVIGGALAVDQVPGAVSGLVASEAIDAVAHIIQVALTPVFLLSGIGTLLNTFNTRLARVSDHTEQIFAQLKDGTADPVIDAAHLARLKQRRVALDVAVIFCATGCAATCGAAFVLFVGGLRTGEIASWLFSLFGLALVCTVCALAAFLVDTVLAWHGLHRDGPLPSGFRPR